MGKRMEKTTNGKNNKDYKSIDSYKPSGIIYDNKFINSLRDKFK
jgi:hypothetical protein